MGFKILEEKTTVDFQPIVISSINFSFTPFCNTDVDSINKFITALDKKEYREILNIIKATVTNSAANIIHWVSIAKKLAISLESDNKYLYAGQFYELRAEYHISPHIQEVNYSKALDMYKKGERYSIKPKYRGADPERDECIEKGKLLAEKLGDTDSYKFFGAGYAMDDEDWEIQEIIKLMAELEKSENPEDRERGRRLRIFLESEEL
ncbi:hypothetical protein KO317_00235 [Candidatus Micrarchaeota archaeon]|nr:hypothetical protein [Candidatus Micrarchaeota archaeon]